MYLSIRVSPRQLVFKSRGAWLEAIESGRWDAGTLERGRLGAGWEMRTVVLSFPQALGVVRGGGRRTVH